MRLPKDKNDRVLFGALSVASGVGAFMLASTMLMTPQFAITFGTNPAEAAIAESAPPAFRAQPARGPVPYAQNIHKLVKAEGPIDIVRDPTDIPPPIGKRGPQRVKVDLDTVEVNGKLADGAT